MLQVEKVSKSYGTNKALNNVLLTIPKGTCYGLIGPNGSGKSTLIKIISRIIRSYEGKIKYIGGSKGTLGYVPQDISLEETLTARTNLEFFGQIHGLKGSPLKKKAERILKDIGLLDRADDIVESFSGGMKRRLNIGCALMHDPELIILDEPTVGVDPQSRRYIFNIVNQLKQQEKTMIYVSHYMEEIENLCDYVAFIDKGNIVEKGEIKELLNRYANPAVYFEAEDSAKLLSKENFTFAPYKTGVIIQTNDPLKTFTELVNLSRDHEFIPEQLSLFKPRLEDLFFQLTGTDLRDQNEKGK
ncbi:ABC transporter ATP-binding protein [Pseudobacillus badius]|uniref:ABC transporter ATP-binding protein n=1 Tax=Bacillus badius TaxID=1455 RepID=UPI0007B074A5|nr:ABC transporter ATP-binding protein [Bacillus badius]KZN99413.1 ABC transporter ATP-binding protein [Bacillus badius]OCS85107.1 ABC transporter ATP-binding protein [Bacillus badius]OVE46753.1 ABC transporter ATP-binding protein [Bacillus badius]TDV98364.1 ABC-2 type transport system ATP-binding protein [Bacillus badius]UAT29006.1 ABC transporter ATP-binding protein [Bacillus badius]